MTTLRHAARANCAQAVAGVIDQGGGVAGELAEAGVFGWRGTCSLTAKRSPRSCRSSRCRLFGAIRRLGALCQVRAVAQKLPLPRAGHRALGHIDLDLELEPLREKPGQTRQDGLACALASNIDVASSRPEA